MLKLTVFADVSTAARDISLVAVTTEFIHVFVFVYINYLFYGLAQRLVDKPSRAQRLQLAHQTHYLVELSVVNALLFLNSHDHEVINSRRAKLMCRSVAYFCLVPTIWHIHQTSATRFTAARRYFRNLTSVR
jgi:hypothetical protein